MNYMKYRLEEDSLGTKEIKETAYYGISSQRAYENFNISHNKVNKHLIYASKESCRYGSYKY